MHGYCSGNERLFELSESSRNALFHHAKCMGLFRDPVPHVSSSDDPEEAWKEWIRQEQCIRLGWAAFVSILHLINDVGLVRPEILLTWPEGVRLL